MTEFGLANNFGHVIFDISLIPAMAYLVNYGLMKERPAIEGEEKRQTYNLVGIMVRDFTFVLISLALYFYFLDGGSL